MPSKNALGQFVPSGGDPAAPVERSVVDHRGEARYYRHRKKRAPVVKHFRVDEILKPENRDEYERLLNDPSSTNDSLYAWLSPRATGPICKGSVGAHRRNFLTDLKNITDASKKAHAFLGVIRRAGASNISEAVQSRYEQLFMESLFEMKPDAKLTPKDWKELSQAMKAIVTTRRDAEQHREDPKVEKPAGKEKATPAENRSEAEAAAAEAGPELVERMRRILNL